jgi:hypothetical protein
MARKRARIAVAARKVDDRRLQTFLMQNLSFLVTIAVVVGLILLTA